MSKFNPPAPLDDWPPKAESKQPVEADVESARDPHQSTEPVIDRAVFHEIDRGQPDPGPLRKLHPR